MRTQLQTDTPLLEFWDATRLRASDEQSADAVGTPGVDAAFRAAVAITLGHGCGQRPGTVLDKGGAFVQARTTPSAGALYPFEVLVSLSDGVRYATYLYDVEAGRISRLSSVMPIPATELATEAGLACGAGEPPQALVTLVARPWKAMAKYGDRGYLYTYLDIGHAATNIAMSALAAGLKPTVHLRFRRQWLAHAFGLTGSCREPQLVVALAPGEPADRTGLPDDVVIPVWRDRRQARLEPPSHQEEQNWNTLRDISVSFVPAMLPRHGRAASIVEPRLPIRPADPLPGPPERVEVRLPRSVGARAVPDAYPRLALGRQSAKGFLVESVSFDAFAGLFDGVSGELDCDFADARGAGVGVQVVVRDVDGLASGGYGYSPGRQALFPLEPGRNDAVSDDEVLAICQGQSGLRHAAALIHLHAPLRPLLRKHGRAGLAEVHFHAAHVAQRLCLNAVRHRVGITCVGGFDDRRCAAVAHLADEDEVIYLLAVGASDPNARKTDRDGIAYSHGMTSARIG